MPIQVRPMLAKTYNPSLYQPGMILQPKLDGIRALYQNGEMVSRDVVMWAEHRLRHIKDALSSVRNAVLDGELYIHGMRLQDINSRASVNAIRIHPDEHSLVYHVFDVIARASTLHRLLWLRKNLPQSSAVVLVPSFVTTSPEQADKIYAKFKSDGYEGGMYRDPFKPYAIPGEVSRKDNRVDWLLKRKDWLDMDAIIVGLKEGDGRLQGTLGSFSLNANGLEFSAGSGITDTERHHFWSLGSLMIGQKVNVQYERLHHDGKPLKPTINFVELPKEYETP